MTEKGGNRETTESTAAVQGATAAEQGAMVETWEYIEDEFFTFGGAVIAALVHLDQSVQLVMLPMCQKKAQRRHCFRLMDLQWTEKT